MQEINNHLKYDLIDLYYSKKIEIWEQSKLSCDLDHGAGIRLEIEPDDAKTIDEVKSFIMHFDVIGTESIILKKKGDD